MAGPLLAGGIIQAVGELGISYKYNRIGDATYPTPGGGKTHYLGGFKLNAEYLTSSGSVPNSVLIPLLGGGSVQLTNNNLSGSISFQVTRITNQGYDYAANGDITVTTTQDDGTVVTSVLDNNKDVGVDLVDLAFEQIKIQGKDSSGATIVAGTSFNGVPFGVRFIGCTVVSCEPLRLAGNDVPTYTVVFNYHKWEKTDSTDT